MSFKFEVKWLVNEVVSLFTMNMVKRDLIRIGLSLNETQRRYGGECLFAKNDEAFIAIGKSSILIGSKDDVYRIDKNAFNGTCYFNSAVETLANDKKFAKIAKSAVRNIFTRIIWRFKVNDLTSGDCEKLMSTEWGYKAGV